MTYSPKLLQIIKKLYFFVNKLTTKEQFRKTKSDFSRSSEKGLDFTSYCLLGISLLKNSLSVELHNLLKINNLPVISKSSYSEGRYKILPEFYQVWNNLLLSLIYEQVVEQENSIEASMPLKTWRGYFLEVVDGTCLVLPQTKELGNYFGYHRNGSKIGKVTSIVMSRVLLKADLLNEYVLQNEVVRIDVSEITVFKNWLWQLNSKAITMLDRGFACAVAFYGMVAYDKPFVCRVSVGFNHEVKSFMSSDAIDSEVEFTINKSESIANQAVKEETVEAHSACFTLIKRGEKVKVRLVKVMLPTGQIEVLATNLMDKQVISVADLGELYKRRWGIETIIDSLKNQLGLMLFSGLKPEGILQEIYATIFVYNLRQLLINDAQILVNQQIKESTKPPKQEQKINKNVALGVLKTQIITMFLAKEPEKIIEELITYFTKNKLSVNPNKKTLKREKSLAKSRHLKTQLNYKSAI